METNVLDERLKFVADFEGGQWSMTELCERYGVTRPTGHKWLARYQEAGRAGRAGAQVVRLLGQEAPADPPYSARVTSGSHVVESCTAHGTV